MNKSESIKELATALAKAQAVMENASKDTANPFFKSRYANLESVVGVIRPALEKFGLSFVQVCHDWDVGARVETIILHESGEWLSCGTMSAPATKADAQGFGSALTYARRYSLSAAFGVATEDDDGNAASKHKPAENKKSLPEYTHARYEESSGAWIDAIKAGKITPEKIIGMVSTKFTLSDELKAKITELGDAAISNNVAEFIREMGE